MYNAMAREARSGRSKAREVSRKLARIHKGAREELSKAEDITLWILGGVAVLGGGWLAYQALTQPAAAATSTTTTTTTTPGTPPSPSPTPPSTTGVLWPAGSYPWAPPSNPAGLPAGFSLTDDLTAQDPMWIAMAQSALNILTRVGSGPVAVSYATAPNGVADTGFMIAIAQIQSYLTASVAQIKTSTPAASFLTNPHTNGVLDLKTLAFLILISAAEAAIGGTAVSPTTTSDPILATEAVVALNDALATGGAMYATLTAGLVPSTPSILSTALSQFQANWNASRTALTIPATGLLDWLSWGAIETFAG